MDIVLISYGFINIMGSIYKSFWLGSLLHVHIYSVSELFFLDSEWRMNERYDWKCDGWGIEKTFLFFGLLFFKVCKTNHFQVSGCYQIMSLSRSWGSFFVRLELRVCQYVSGVEEEQEGTVYFQLSCFLCCSAPFSGRYYCDFFLSLSLPPPTKVSTSYFLVLFW